MDLPIPDTTLRPAFVVSRPVRQTAPLVFVSAHSGTDYDPAFLRDSRLDQPGLRRSEDMFVDELFAAATHHGAPLLCATFPRAYCDANREKWELDPAMFDGALPTYVNTSSLRVGAGLGTIARVVGSGEAIYREKLSFAEAAQRVERCWQPFHDALRRLVDETRRSFGGCLLIDCHSMPSQGMAQGSAQGMGRPAQAEIVLGDAHGTSCLPAAMRALEQAFLAMGRSVRRNDPYAGGYITRHYGRPREGVQALQVEIARGLYMDEDKLQKRPAFARLQQDLAVLIGQLAASSCYLVGCEAKKMAAP
jgi:N-formylglutamate deformylase